MKTATLVVAVALALPLAACDQPKSRPDAQAPSAPLASGADRQAAAPAMMPAAGGPPAPPTSDAVTKKAGMAGFYVDYVNTAPDPLNKQPAVVASGEPITIGGFAFDAETRTPAKSVDLVIDGKAYGVAYGAPRPDVAGFYKTGKLTKVGYKVTFPADAIAKGDHTLLVRVLSPDGQFYQESAPVKFTVQ